MMVSYHIGIVHVRGITEAVPDRDDNGSLNVVIAGTSLTHYPAMIPHLTLQTVIYFSTV